ncbi:hypothetical protein U27_01873 [Candidatus Vecturithrix granuli]|uniref:Type II restriction endonuclease EcoO109IR domain-containing protein n=1 Tax=Vecturithrix granuli TaxID=1499967 RepID=A0A0S6W9C1_VECG1|nr:hypothetical protein U27_01873 [Candidatus Vecturithrix granuli]
MRQISQQEIIEYVEANIPQFHQSRLNKLLSLKLEEILKHKNPYLFKARNICTAEELVRNTLDAFLSSSEEGLFGEFLEKLAIFICVQVFGGRKSSAEGIDLEFEQDHTKFIVSIKSGPNWGNSGQVTKMVTDFKKAKKILRSNTSSTMNIVAVNGCCYGRDNRPDKGDYLKLCGQRFWTLISGSETLYTDIIEPLGHRAKEKNEKFLQEYSKVVNKFTLEFIQTFCDSEGQIHWDRVVQLNSARRYDLEKYPLATEEEKRGNLSSAIAILEDICRKGTPEVGIHKRLSQMWRKLYKEHFKNNEHEEAVNIIKSMMEMYEFLEQSEDEAIQHCSNFYFTLSDARILFQHSKTMGSQEWSEKASYLINKFKNA